MAVVYISVVLEPYVLYCGLYGACLVLDVSSGSGSRADAGKD